MAEVIVLHGGPWHGRVVQIEEGRCFTIVAPEPVDFKKMFEQPENAAELVKFREGHYSRVGRSHDFEWDGWKTHG